MDFWPLIEKIKDHSGDDDALRVHLLKQHLLSSQPKYIEDFNEFFVHQVVQAFNWSLRGAITLMKGYKEEYEFIPYIDYLISEGKEVFETALNEPDELAGFELMSDSSYIEIEYRGVIHEAYEELTELELPETNIEIPDCCQGTQTEANELNKLYPKIASKYGQ